jgi:hypothetical protein
MNAAQKISRKIKSALRGDASLGAALLETGRRVFLAARHRRERARLGKQFGQGAKSRAHPARLASASARMSEAELLAHFRERAKPRFFEGFETAERDSPRDDLSREKLEASVELANEAREIVAHRWPLLGYGALDFGAEVDWLRDPVSGVRWPLDYHGDAKLVRGDGSDVRVLWELNRLGHIPTLARAYAPTRDESFAEEVFAQIESWSAQNPTGFGPNWACAMEVSLRALNLLAAFELLRHSHALDSRRLAAMLALFDAHGRHVRRNLEYSFIATGNHYLSDVVGLLWLGVCLPELEESSAWREFALRELMREMDKQILDDGADCEASTGYHCFVTELLLYSFILCRTNGVEIEERYLTKLRSMLEYLRVILRPDGCIPLVGDADGGRALSITRRAADDRAYLLGVGAAFFREPRFKTEERAPEEVFWLLGDEGVRAFNELETSDGRAATSEVFEQAGVCVLRAGDLYLMLGASGAGLAGRGAHAHNDALGIEVSACGASFIADPGTYVYTADPRARHLFRSTAYHSTVEVDATEQSEINVGTPFLIGDEARPRILAFASERERDFVVAGHHGYERLTTGPVTHRRAVLFDKSERYWLVEDTFEGSGAHAFTFRFHAAPGREMHVRDGSTIEIRDGAEGARLLVASLDSDEGAALERRWASRDYGSRVPTHSARWTLTARAPLRIRWLLVPIRAGEETQGRLELIARVRDESKSEAVLKAPKGRQ